MVHASPRCGPSTQGHTHAPCTSSRSFVASGAIGKQVLAEQRIRPAAHKYSVAVTAQPPGAHHTRNQDTTKLPVPLGGASAKPLDRGQIGCGDVGEYDEGHLWQ
jgi:hypothetical protein